VNDLEGGTGRDKTERSDNGDGKVGSPMKRGENHPDGGEEENEDVSPDREFQLLLGLRKGIRGILVGLDDVCAASAG
jgi:hypothetical protein